MAHLQMIYLLKLFFSFNEGVKHPIWEDRDDKSWIPRLPHVDIPWYTQIYKYFFPRKWFGNRGLNFLSSSIQYPLVNSHETMENHHAING